MHGQSHPRRGTIATQGVPTKRSLSLIDRMCHHACNVQCVIMTMMMMSLMIWSHAEESRVTFGVIGF
jgi:hypothetical protein